MVGIKSVPGRKNGITGKRLTVFCAAAIFCAAALLAFSLRLSASVGDDYTIETRGHYIDMLYNSSNGMPTSEANDIIQGDDGFIWIACYSGLIRYDGVDFERLSNYGLSSVCGLYSDSQSRLWIATNDHGIIQRVSDNSFITYSKEDGLNSASVRAIGEFYDGSIVVGTTGGLHRINPNGTIQMIGSDSLNVQHMGAMAVYHANRTVCVSNNGDVYCTKGSQTLSCIPYSGDVLSGYPQPISVSYASDGSFWFGTDSNLILLGTVSMEGELQITGTVETGELENINRIRFIGDRAWICADNGIGYIENGVCFPVPTLLDNSVDSMCRDNEGNLWFASSRKGVLKLTENNFRDISGSLGISDKVTNTAALTENYLYVGTDSGLYIADRTDSDYSTQVSNALTEALDGIRIRCTAVASDGKLWLATYAGAYCFDEETGDIAVFNTENGLTTNKTRLCTELADGRIAVGTSAGLFLIENGKVTESYNESNGLINSDVLAVCQGPDGQILIGTDGGGVFSLKDGRITEAFTGENSLESDIVMRIKYDGMCGGYWLVTGSALEFYDGETLRKLENFPYFNNYDLYYNSDSPTLWVLGSGGIYIVDRVELLSGETVSYTSFKHADGLISDLTANSYSCLGEDGMLYVCSSTGLLAVDWNSIGHSRVPKITIPCVYADGEYFEVTDGRVEIPSSTARLTIECYALTYTLQDPLLRYELHGLDTGPTSILRSEMGELRYNSLDGGEYRFVLEVVEPISGNTVTKEEIRIIKPQKFTETTAFTVLVCVGAVAAAALLIALYSRRKIRIATKKSEEARHLTGEIISTFSKVIDAKDKYTNGHSLRVAEYSKKIAEKLGIDPSQVEDIYNIALLHDIGKLGIPDGILNKDGPLDDEEYLRMKLHTEIGSDILSDIDVLPDIGLGAKYHHERYDGRGYLNGLKGEEIPLFCRIIAVADSFDAMNSTRVYRKNMPAEKILAELEKGSGTQFDPEAVGALLDLIHDGDVKLNVPAEETPANEEPADAGSGTSEGPENKDAPPAGEKKKNGGAN